MTSGHCWESVCAHCGRVASFDRRWQEEKPSATPPHEKLCCEAVCFSDAAPVARWEYVFVKPLGLHRISGFSTSESDFVPHFNTSLGRHVESLSHMKALQAATGSVDAVVKGDGADRHAPRDIGSRLKHHREVREAIDRGEALRPARGVEVRYTEDD